ncbi:uncharacterized protein Z520_05340 [Fonsecaea multimorphosa CBS 102226]|uniref:Benzoate 4-monooxygenase bphA n=1 Tax=Fonsecaea multimorphosa CBS 102226 TaxID=1442371 RepID=A0A0D2K6Y4_9EURO|nr:uncharacterized protein Z520_05340 [Fonsecaea multimorphosa CBS 102226]KIX98879.1 hypothetical protein Z520_05340 [Fonsecaea multimorphosa CBS 102226]
MFVTSLVSPWALLLLPVLYFLLPYLRNWSLMKVPGPLPAALSNLWLMYQCRRGRRYKAVDELHKKYGKVVRIQPNHVSIADDSAINIIYGHGNGFLKSEYYDAFVSIRRGLFNTRDRAEHTRKRKVVSHTFSAKSIGQFEQYIHANLELFVQKWRNLSNNKSNPQTGYASIDSLNWFNYLAFDIIGDLAFGQPFGMLEKEKDIAEIRKSPDAPPTTAPAIEVLNRRGEVSGTLGCLPQLKPYAKYLPDPFFSRGVEAVENLAGIAIARVQQRLENPNTDRVDLLARLMEGKDANGAKLGREELTAEALTQLIAGSDTTSNTACAILYYVVRTPGVIEKLQKELDANIGPGVPQYEQVRDLEYVQWVINETMRIHSTSSLGLPRLTPMPTPENPNPKPVEILGYTFPPGTALSVPSYTIHHSKEIWGADADEFVPERWSEKRLTPRQKEAFIPFSVGPRACVGRNVAEMELKCMVASIFRNFEFRDEHEGPLQTREGFLRKPLGFNVGIRVRANA